MKLLKIGIRKRYWNVFGDVMLKMKKADEEVMRTSLLSDMNPSDIIFLNNLITARGKYEMVIQQHKAILHQKSREKWLKDGAANTRFFHTSVKIRKARNAIPEVEDENGSILVDQNGITSIMEKHFEEKFNKVMMEAILTPAEIKEAVFQLNVDSAPGPDGFPGFFYRFAWDIIGDGVIQAIQF
ncbi:uncharacterized protein LOC113294798 [Papaver somniferum]|uniref:uncharacterized protein LOC113294798 n=1 Tax=Papaver somniferum TaxID=3469 RepID=UPI000E6F818E|nr:uncharacterized protein LOC113294798 [Papaver somniferum]